MTTSILTWRRSLFFTAVSVMFCALFIIVPVQNAYANTVDPEADGSVIDEASLEEVKPVNRYLIEYILFKQAVPDMAVLEFEKVGKPITPSMDAVHLYSHGFSNHPVAPTSVPLKALSGTQKRLNRKGYTVLASGAWQQAIDSDEQTAPLVISSTSHINTARFDGVAIEGIKGDAPDTESSLSERTEDFYAELTIKRSRYMHASLSLDYRFKQVFPYASMFDYILGRQGAIPYGMSALIPLDQDFLSMLGSTQEVSEHTITSFHLEQSRRIKSGEIHYIDHPYLGALITIQRLKEDE